MLGLLRENRFGAVDCDLDKVRMEGRSMLAAIRRAAPNTAAATLLGISLRRLHYKLKRLSISSQGGTDEHPFPLTEHPKKRRRDNHVPLARPWDKKRRSQGDGPAELVRSDPHR